MELDQLKSAWNNIENPSRTSEEIRDMLLENKHPVLKGIRRQLTIEISGWSVFLLCYYTTFDGEYKPLWINILLTGCILSPLIHNLTGYRFAKYLVHGKTIKESLEHYLSKLRIYALISIISRVILTTGLLLFFTYGLHFDTRRHLLLAVAVLVFLFQLLVLYRLWAKRLKKLRNTVINLN